MNNTFREKLVRLNHGRLFVIGLEGNLRRPLSEVRGLLEAGLSNTTVAPVQKQHGRDFLAAFTFRPILDITIDRYNDESSSIVGYSLDEHSLERSIEEIARDVGFLPLEKPSPEFRRGSMDNLGHEIMAYQSCKLISKQLRRPFEKVWGTVKYANFLNQYGYMPDEEALKMAKEKFGLSF